MPDDYSADRFTTGTVAVGDTATGNIESSRDRDWFAVELVAGRTYVIDLRGSPTGDGTLSDPYLRGIHDSDGNLIPRTTNDDGGQDYNSRVTFTATESGTHYIAAGVYFGRGTYEVEVTDTSPPIVAPDPDSEDPPDTQEQVQQQPPAFGSQFYGFDLPEDTDGSANRISLGTVSATDPDGGSVTYSIEGGNAAGLFEIDAASGELFYTGGGEDYEPGSTSFELTVRASEGDQTTDTTVAVNVTDVAEAPAFGQAGYGFDLAEDTDGSANRISLGTVSATDPDGGSVTYSIEGGNAAGLFEIDAASGELFYTGGGEDYETGSTSFELTVRASDGDQTTDTTATVSVTDVDEPVEVDPPVAQPDPARAAAEDLGDITELASARFPPGTLDGGVDGVAWYRFTLSEARAVGLGLRRQDADADLVLEDAEGNVLHSSERSGTANEWMRETLLAGTYYVRVEAQEAGANAYVFRYGVGDADPAEVARLEAERASAQEQVQQQPPAFGSQFYGFELPENTDGSANRISLGTVSATDPDGGFCELQHRGRQRGGAVRDRRGQRRAVLHGHGRGLRCDQLRADCPGGDGDRRPTPPRPSMRTWRKHRRFELRLRSGGGHGPARRAGHGLGDRRRHADLQHRGRQRGRAVRDDAASGELFYTGGGEDYETGSTSFELTVRASDRDQTTDTTATVSVTDVDEPVEVDPPVAEPDQSTPQTVSEPAGEDFSAGASTSGRVAVGDTATGNIGSNGDRDWFAVELEAGRTYVIDLRGSPTDDGTLSDPHLGGIHDSDGNLIARTTNDDGGEGYNSRVTFTATGSGTHYIAAGAAGIFSGRGTYEVEVTDTSPPIVAPDPDSEDPPVAQEQVQQQEQDEPPAETVIPPAEPETAQAQDEAASVSEGDTDLPADSTTTGRVVVGGSATGNIGSNGDRDWFAVDLEAGKTYWFDLEGSWTDGGTLRDPYLRGIYDANGELIDGTTDDHAGVWDNSRVYFTPAEGATYYVSAGGHRNATGTYTLTVNETPDDDYAEDRTTTGRVVVGGSATGTIEVPGDDWDWFAVELEAGQAYRFDLEGSATGGGTLRDPYLFAIYDSEERYQSGTYNDNSGVGKNSRVDFAAAEGATYYVVVASSHVAEGGTYTLSVSEISDDYAADRTTTGRVVVDGSATGNVEYNRDTDWFAVELEAGQAYRFDLEGSSTGGGTLRDPVLTGIYDSAGRQSVGYHDDGGVDRNSRAYFAPAEGATYYVSAGTYGNYQGTYTLRVTDLGPVSVSEGGTDLPANSTTPGRVMVDSSATGEIERARDRDWFAVELEADKMYRFDLEGAKSGDGTLVDPYLRGIYDEDGDRIDGTSDWSSGVGLNCRVFFTPDEGATYYVSAGSHSYQIGTYTLTVTDVTDYPDDYAADPTTTGTVVVGGSATGDVEYRGDADWFAVTLEAGKAYYFDLKGSPTGDGTLGDPYLRGIYDEEGDRFDRTRSDDTGVGQRNSRVLFTPDEDATYYVSAGAYGNYQGTYTLSVSEISDDYAADPATTGTVVPDGSATGDVEYHGDRDWFAVTLEAGKTYRFDLQGALDGGGNLWKPYLRGIYDANGALIDGTTDDDSPGVDRSSQVYFRPDEDATYYVSAAGAYRDATGTYTLVVTEISDDYAADPTTTGTVAVGGSATGNIEPLGDRDWFAVDLEADKAYRFDLQGRPGGGGTLRDTVLRGIYDSEGRYQSGSYNDDFGGSRNSRVLFTPDEDATYYVSAGGYRNHVGTYTLSVEEVDAM